MPLPATWRWGQFTAVLGHGGADMLIAATALEHGVMMVTRIVMHLEPASAPLLNALDGDGSARV